MPQENPLTEAKLKLGRRLYFDKALSSNNTLSCASCHLPEKGFADPRQFSLGVHGQKGGRQAPALINRAFSRKQFWDGRAASLEVQALGPIMNPIEMARPNMKSVVSRLEKDASYVAAFKAAFLAEGGAINDITISRALASFERSIMSGNSPYDRFTQLKDSSAMSESAQRGYHLFLGKANCASCHVGFNFTDESYHNLGLGVNAKKPDLGRYAISKLDGQQGAFKTPTLREIANTAPYMNDGSLKTLEEVIEFYDKGCRENKWLSAKIKPLGLTTQEKQDLVEFLKALSGEVVWYGKDEDLKHAAAQSRYGVGKM
ncbi:MAG: c-type cytochrome [Acidobacteria bacterium]|nr:c-type cytochrome [Acidobacteriota bacterium]MBI3423866.1 c-type cytochrome [Acidobacteriota bacterium]